MLLLLFRVGTSPNHNRSSYYRRPAFYYLGNLGPFGDLGLLMASPQQALANRGCWMGCLVMRGSGRKSGQARTFPALARHLHAAVATFVQVSHLITHVPLSGKSFKPLEATFTRMPKFHSRPRHSGQAQPHGSPKTKASVLHAM